ncbi:MAG: LysR family transcriptional regulator [Elusimicrobia bacterium]|nr:LysR family transcriptional regulator [Elusimicrobiota bacterium]
MIKLKTKIWLEKNGKLIFGEGRFRILKEIERTNSINQAAANLHMSFRHAWSYINIIEKNLVVRLIDRRRGGKDGGGSHLTPQAKYIMKKFEKLNEVIKQFADKKFKEIFNEKF